MCPRNGIKHNAVINVPQPILSVVDSCLVFYFVLTYMTNMAYMLAPLHISAQYSTGVQYTF